MNAADLRRRLRGHGFILHELTRAHGNRFLICDRRGLAVKGTDEEPLTAEDVARFCACFEADPLDPVLEQEREQDEWLERERREVWP